MLIGIVVLLILLIVAWLFKIIVIRHSLRLHEYIDKVLDCFSKILYNVLFPLMFFNIFVVRGLNIADIAITVTVLAYVAISLVTLMVLGRRIDTATRNSVILTYTFPNVVFLGFPIVMSICGNLFYASLYSLVIFVLNLVVGGLLGINKKYVIKSVITLPILYGFITGLLVHYTIPLQITYIVSYVNKPISIISTYGAAVVTGYSLPVSLSYIRIYKKLIILQVIYRLIFSPLIHLLIGLAILQMPYIAFKQVLIESMMPPALSNVILSRVYNWNTEFASISTLISTFIALIVVPLLSLAGII